MIDTLALSLGTNGIISSSSVPSLARLLARSFVHSSIRSFVRLFVCSYVRSLVRWFIGSLVRSFVRSFVRSLRFVAPGLRTRSHGVCETRSKTKAQGREGIPEIEQKLLSQRN